MTQPEGFSNGSNLVCKLHKALYGLKQAPRAWFERLAAALVKFGFTGSKYDPSLFIHSHSIGSIYVLVYVDDIIIIGASASFIQDLIMKLHSEFALKDLRPLHYFLGLEVHHFANGSLLLSQQKYIRDLLLRSKMDKAKPISTPMVLGLKISKHGSDKFDNPSLYRSVVGALQYATVTRPKISFSVNKACQFMAKPLESHWKVVKRIPHFLGGTLHHGLHLTKPVQPLGLGGFCDANWASDIDDRRSTFGACVFLGPNLVSWWSKKQPLVARSSIEAEYISLADITEEIMWLQSLLEELKVPSSRPVIYCYNLSTVMLSHNPVLHSRTKHMELSLFFVREKVIIGKLLIAHVPSSDQPAD